MPSRGRNLRRRKRDTGKHNGKKLWANLSRFTASHADNPTQPIIAQSGRERTLEPTRLQETKVARFSFSCLMGLPVEPIEPFPKEPICVHIILKDFRARSLHELPHPFLANLKRRIGGSVRIWSFMAVEASSEKKGKWGWSDVVYVGMILGSLLGFAVMHWR
jgi:hypothetical protein